MLILGLDASLARCSAAVLANGVLRAEACEEGGRGYATILPAMARDVLRSAGLTAAALDGVAVTVGPGSFTGLRAALALAHGIASGISRPVAGVLVAEALAEALSGSAPEGDGRTLWVAIDSRRGRVFLHRGDAPAESAALDALPRPAGPVVLAGDAAAEVAARMAARGDDVALTGARLPLARHVAMVGARRLAGILAPLPAQPLYVDPPEARLPAGGLRPAPDERIVSPVASWFVAAPAHAEVISAMHAAAMPDGDAWDEAAITALLALPGTFALVAPQAGMVLARVAADEGEILTLAVVPPARRHGSGASLLAAAEQRAAASGAQTMYLEVAETNQPARALYAQAGYALAGRRRAYYRDGSDALLLRKPISPAAAADG